MIPVIRAVVDGLIHVTLVDVATALATYTKITVYEDTDSAGSFATTTGNITLVADTTGYSLYDQDGTSSVYYRCKLSDAGGTTLSAVSNTRQYGTQQAYCTAFDTRGELSQGTGTATINAMTAHWIWEDCVAVSRLIDRYAIVEDDAYQASGSETRYVNGSGKVRLWLPWPATSISAVSVEETDGTYTSWTEDADWYEYPYQDSGAPTPNPILRLDVNEKSDGSKSVWTVGQKRVKVVAVWGMATSVPDIIARAAKIQVAQWYKLAMQGWSDTGGSPEFGQLEYPRKLDKAVKLLVDQARPRRPRI